MMFNLMGSVLSEYPSQAREPGRRRLGTCCQEQTAAATARSASCTGAVRFCEQDSFPLSSLGLSLFSLRRSLSHPAPPWEIPACRSNPSSGVSSSRTCPSAGDGTSLPCFLKSMVLSHHNSQVSVGPSSASHVDAFLSPHLELKITSIPHNC